MNEEPAPFAAKPAVKKHHLWLMNAYDVIYQTDISAYPGLTLAELLSLPTQIWSLRGREALTRMKIKVSYEWAVNELDGEDVIWVNHFDSLREALQYSKVIAVSEIELVRDATNELGVPGSSPAGCNALEF